MRIYPCIGTSLNEIYSSLYRGKSGTVVRPEHKLMGYRSALTGVLPTPELKDILGRREHTSVGQESKFAYMTARNILNAAQMDLDFLRQNETGIPYGNDSVAESVVLTHDKIRGKKDTALLGSGAILRMMDSTVTMSLSTLFQLRGVDISISTACASGSYAVGLGYLLVQSDMQDCIIYGGAQKVDPYCTGSFDGSGVFSICEEAPTLASRPFDAHQDGLVPNGGAVTLILESYGHALKRGVTPIVEAVGYGFSPSGAHISAPSVEGPARAIRRALQNAGVQPHEIDYINAHVTSTPIGDANGAGTIYEVFGNKTPVSSTKSTTGYECWMAGVSELIHSILMMQCDFIAPNINFETPNRDSAKLNIISSTQQKSINAFSSNSFGSGGTNSALIIKKISVS